MNYDSAGHLYADVDNIRITYIPSTDRDQNSDWAGSDVIRVQAYKQPGTSDKSLHRGAEFPIGSAEEFVNLLSGLCSVYNAGRQAGANTG